MAKPQPQAGQDIVIEVKKIADRMDELKMKLANGTTSTELRKEAAAAQVHFDEIAKIKSALAREVDKKNDRIKTITSLRKKVRDGAKGQYGDNSDEYAAVGGTKTAERKKPTKKVKKEQ